MDVSSGSTRSVMFTRDRVYPIQPLAKLDDVCLKSPGPSARIDIDSSRLMIFVAVIFLMFNIDSSQCETVSM